MKQGIHPNWHHDTQVTCSCGNSFVTGSTQPTLQVDICSSCHPFFTGEVKFVDRQGRVDKFKKKMAAAQAAQAKKAGKKTKKAAASDQKSYKDILRDQQKSMRKAKKADSTESEKSSSSK